MQSKSQQIALKQSFNSTIWRIEVEEETNILAIETRDAASHTAAFSAFDFTTGKTYFREVAVENSWWHGLDKVYKSNIFIHGYASEAGPEHKGIIALGLSGNVKWQQFNTTLERTTTEGLIAYNSLIRPKRLVLLSAETGEQLGGAAAYGQPLPNSIVVPEIAEKGAIIPQNTEGMILKSTHADKTVWAFHTRNGNFYDQRLLIERAGEVIYEDKLSTGIQKLNPEAFFLLKGFLIYIRNKNEIVSYSL